MTNYNVYTFFTNYIIIKAGASIPLRQLCISPLFQIYPLFPKNFPWKISQMLPFTEKYFDLHPPKFLTTFFQSTTANFEFPPLFSLFSDTVDHDVLVERLARTYGLRSTALDWLRSYLLDRRQSV